jgi:hypothetical protein
MSGLGTVRCTGFVVAIRDAWPSSFRKMDPFNLSGTTMGQ